MRELEWYLRRHEGALVVLEGALVVLEGALVVLGLIPYFQHKEKALSQQIFPMSISQ